MEKNQKIRVKCPKCNNVITMNVDIGSLEFEGGLASISILHGTPPHTLIIYIDKEGLVRSIEATDLSLVVIPEEKVEEKKKVIPIKELKKLIGKEFFEFMFSAMVANTPIYVYTMRDPMQLLEFFSTIFKDFPTEINIVVDEIINKFGISILDPNSYERYKEKISRMIIYDMTAGKFIGFKFRTCLLYTSPSPRDRG